MSAIAASCCHLHTVSKNAPSLAGCSFDKHGIGLILIIFGKRHQHAFINDMVFNFPYTFSFTYFICFK